MRIVSVGPNEIYLDDDPENCNYFKGEVSQYFLSFFYFMNQSHLGP